jgi:hypothetical protein
MKKVFTYMLIPKIPLGFLPMLGDTCLFLFTSFLVRAQERTVKDEGYEPLPQDLVKAAVNGVTTDAGVNILHTLL